MPSSPAKPDVVISIVLKNDKVLFIERPGLKGLGAYMFPGGKVEACESEAEASEREVLEETGYLCRAERKIGARIHPTTGARLNYWLCSYLDRDMRKRAEFSTVWAPLRHVEAIAGPALFQSVKDELAKVASVALQPSVSAAHGAK